MGSGRGIPRLVNSATAKPGRDYTWQNLLPTAFIPSPIIAQFSTFNFSKLSTTICGGSTVCA